MFTKLTDTYTLANGKNPHYRFRHYGRLLMEIEGKCQTALLAGYRHIDTAYAYGNEVSVGEGLRARVPRERYLSPQNTGLLNADMKTIAAVEASLKNLGLDYLIFIRSLAMCRKVSPN